MSSSKDPLRCWSWDNFFSHVFLGGLHYHAHSRALSREKKNPQNGSIVFILHKIVFYNYSIVLYCRYPIAYNFILRRKSFRYIALIVCLRLLLPSLSDHFQGGGGLCWMTLHFFLLGEVKLNENKFPTEIDNGKSLHFYPLRITRNILHSFSTLFMSTAMQHPRWLSIFGFISKSCIYDYQNIT